MMDFEEKAQSVGLNVIGGLTFILNKCETQ